VADGKALDGRASRRARPSRDALKADSPPPAIPPAASRNDQLDHALLWMLSSSSPPARSTAAGRGAGRDVPDPHPLHGDEPALSYRHRLGRRLPAGHQLRAGAITGNIYAGLWYPIFFTGHVVVVRADLHEGNAGKPLDWNLLEAVEGTSAQ
jgi:hypothetical protein